MALMVTNLQPKTAQKNDDENNNYYLLPLSVIGNLADLS